VTFRCGTDRNVTITLGPADPPNNQNVVLTIFARIPASQDVRAGAYADTVAVIVNF